MSQGDFTIKATATACNDDYEYPENYKSKEELQLDTLQRVLSARS